MIDFLTSSSMVGHDLEDNQNDEGTQEETPMKLPKNTPLNTNKNEEQKQKRLVWKPVLSTPFNIKWPETTAEVAEKLLKELLNIFNENSPSNIVLNGFQSSQSEFLTISQYKIQRRCLKRKIRQLQIPDYKKPPDLIEKKALPGGASLNNSPTSTLEKLTTLQDQIPQRPSSLNYILSGINAVTKALEREIYQKSSRISNHSASNPSTTEELRKFEETAKFSCSAPATPPTNVQDGEIHSSNLPAQDGCRFDNFIKDREQLSSDPPTYHRCRQLSLIFICKDDLNPISLVEHLIPAIASVNQQRLLENAPGSDGMTAPQPLLMVPLPKGAEEQVAAALGIKRAAVVGLQGMNKRIESLFEFAKQHIKIVLPPNLKFPQDEVHKGLAKVNQSNQHNFIPTHVKYYKTTAPNDMRKHQSERLEAKRNKKAHRNLKKTNLDSKKTKKNKKRNIEN